MATLNYYDVIDDIFLDYVTGDILEYKDETV